MSQHVMDLGLSSGTLAEVAVPLPLPGSFTYRIPTELESKAKAGVRVRIPFKNREMIGYLVGTHSSPGPQKLKSIIDILDDEPVLSPGILELTHWIAGYYACGWGEAIENAIPKWVKYGRKAARALARDAASPAEASSAEAAEPFTLTPDQQTSLTAILDAFGQAEPKPVLLFGVTGSGKSEVYIRALRQNLERGRTAICLVPEIALTEQLRRFFLAHFGDQLEILHSKLSDGERFLAWKRIESGQRRIVLGPRSAVYAPVPDLGLIIMDEEHEGSYKQETAPRYHAREVAAWRAHNEQAVFVMGTATPSLETMHASQSGAVQRIELTTRVDDRPLPKVMTVDLKTSPQASSSRGILSRALSLEIENNLRRKEGTLLLLNRRGFSTHINCNDCGNIETCPSCQVSLIFHQEDNTLLCHYCNFHKAVPRKCGECGSLSPRFGGYGTEKVESEICRIFPAARVARMDTDSVRRKGSHEVILKQFRNQEIDILIGTQMIAKGFDFPHVTLVGVILADVGLALPDFRSSERTFQLLTQVAGRAGRGTREGRVFIQTFSPDHPSVRFAAKHDFPSFYEQECPQRQDFEYPPFCRLINIMIRGKDEKRCYQHALDVRTAMREKLSGSTSVQILGPAPLPFYRLRGQFRWHLMLKLPSEHQNLVEIQEAIASVKKPSGVQLAIDVDPLNIL